MFNRAPACRREDAERLLYGEKTLVQAWSLRGAPVVFPAAESAAFLSALVPAKGEPWAYTKGIGLALDALGMEFDRQMCIRDRPYVRQNRAFGSTETSFSRRRSGDQAFSRQLGDRASSRGVRKDVYKRQVILMQNRSLSDSKR